MQIRLAEGVLALDILIRDLEARLSPHGSTTRKGDLKPGAIRLATLIERRAGLLEQLNPTPRRRR